MKAAQRQKKLLELLKYNSDYETAQNLSQLLKVSKRTIYGDLQQLESEGYIFEKRRGNGIRLQNEGVTENSVEQDFYSPEKRRRGLIKQLLFEEKRITYQASSEKYMVSVSSIIEDINYIKKAILDDATAYFVGDKNGTRLVGEEDAWQRTLIAFNNYLLTNENVQYREKRGLEILSEYYDAEHLKVCLELVCSLKDYNIYYVAEYYRLNLFNVLVVLCYRLSLGVHHIKERKAFYFDQVMGLVNYAIAKDLLEVLSKKLHISYEEGDLCFLSMYLSANHVVFSASNKNFGKDFDETLTEIIRIMSNCVDVDLTQDGELRNSLCLHLIPMIHRMKNRIYIKNPMLDEIKEEYHLMFDLTWIVAELLEKRFDLSMTEDEVGFLALHFQNALEKQKKSRRILVVCPNGFTTSSLIANRIRRILPPLDIIELASYDNIETFNYASVDFVVSTIPLEIEEKPVVVVSALPNEQDISKIEELYKKELLHAPEIDTKEKYQYLSKYLPKKYIFFNKKKITKEEILQTVCEKLYRDGIVDEQYYSTILEREEKGGTDIVTGGAIPHGQMDSVKETRLVLWVNKESVKWSKYRVKVVVFFVLSKKDLKHSKSILEEAFSLIKKRECETFSVNNDIEGLL